jgi:uncharacterized protein (UPF0548 family)
MRWSRVPAAATADTAAGAHDRYDAIVRLQPGETAAEAFQRVKRRLVAYDVFPPRVLRYALCPAGTLEKDAVIVQRFGFSSVWLEFAVRVVDIWDRETARGRSAGFTYVTLAGHPEQGAESFSVELIDSRVRVTVEARSRPGTLLTRIGRPVQRSLQVRLTKAAVRRVSGNIPVEFASRPSASMAA